MRWSRWPLPLFALAVGLAGILRLRSTEGQENSGYLLAGAALILAGGWFALEVMRDWRDKDDEKRKKDEEGGP